MLDDKGIRCVSDRPWVTAAETCECAMAHLGVGEREVAEQLFRGAQAMREADGKMEFLPNRVEIKKGEQVKFMLRNNGELDHELVLGTLAENLKHGEQMQKNPDMEHDDPNAKRLAPKKSGEIVWKFTKAGEFDFSCLIPGHREAGMTGTIVVK